MSVVTPTRGKTQKWLPQLYRCFLSQTYGPKELIVVDSSKRVSDSDARAGVITYYVLRITNYEFR